MGCFSSGIIGVEQERKLFSDNGSIHSYRDVEEIEKALKGAAEKLKPILEKLKNQVHRNDPNIPKSFFDSDGKYISIRNKKIKVKHSNWMFRVPNNVDKALFLREKIELYISYIKEANENG